MSETNTIDRIETWADEKLGFVRVTTNDGAEGWGQLSPYHSDIAGELVHRLLARRVLGKDAGRIEQIVDDCVRFESKYYGTHFMRALCGIDTALWDLAAKRSPTTSSSPTRTAATTRTQQSRTRT